MPDETQQEQRISRRRARRAALPAIFVNSYSLDWGSDSVRISFAEYLHGERHYRVAVVLPMADAESLAEALMRIVEKAKAEASESS